MYYYQQHSIYSRFVLWNFNFFLNTKNYWFFSGLLKRLPSFKYYNVQKQGSRFTLGSHAAKNTQYIKKFFKRKLLSIKLCTRKSVGAYVYLPGARGHKRLRLLNIIIYKNGKVDLLSGSMLAKNTHYIKKCFKLKLLSIELRTKKSVGAHIYLPPDHSGRPPKTDAFEIL